jgi:cytochrome c553
MTSNRWIWCAMLLAIARIGQAADPTVEQASQLCAACHGPDGNSVNPEWPNLAGQSATYLKSQLQAFRCAATGMPAGCVARRDGNAVLMIGPVTTLTDASIVALAKHYATQTPKPASPVAGPTAGETLYKQGKKTVNALACGTCHLADGRGDPENGVPRIAGQQAVYAATQLRAIRDGVRTGEGATRMQGGVRGFTNAEFDAISAYLAGLK